MATYIFKFDIGDDVVIRYCHDRVKIARIKVLPDNVVLYTVERYNSIDGEYWDYDCGEDELTAG